MQNNTLDVTDEDLHEMLALADKKPELHKVAGPEVDFDDFMLLM